MPLMSIHTLCYKDVHLFVGFTIVENAINLTHGE